MMKFIFYSLLISFFFSCQKGHELDCLTTNGDEATEIRYPGTFKYIEIDAKLEVNIFQGNEYKVEVSGGKHIIKDVTTTVTDNLLKITNTSVCNFVRGYKRMVTVNITLPYVAKIYNNSVSSIILDYNFNQDTTLFVSNTNSGDTYINGKFNEVSTASHGAGDIYLSGSSQILLIYSNGTNFTFAENFSVTTQVFISTYSIGDAKLNLQGVNNFGYYIWNTGNIYYTGNPDSITNVGLGKAFGKGQLIKQD